MTKNDEPQQVIATLGEHGMSIVSPKAAKKLEEKKLSASLVTGLTSDTACHARWMADQFVIPEIIEQPIDNAGRRGNVFHDIMETFFAYPPEERTTENMKATVDMVLAEKYPDMGQIRDVVEWVRDAVNGYYEMGAKPEEVDVASIPQKNKWTGEEYETGLEVFVEGKVGNTKRDALGFIDRLVHDKRRDDGALVVEDWKTGRQHKWNPKTQDDKGLAELRQQIAYTMLLEQKGYKVSAARLIYPIARSITNVDIDDEEMRVRTMQAFEEADRIMDNLVETNHFGYSPSFLCAWCPLAKICPKATVKPYTKMQEAYAKQPEPAELRKGIEFN